MTASPQMLAAFEAWKLAELASHYAAPCPDEVMEHLVELAGTAFDALQAAPAANADDMLLKLFPLVIRDMEPAKGEPPMRPMASRSYSYPDAFYARLIADLGTVSPHLRAAIASPASARAGSVA
jgi:hypothetical protein